MPIKRRLFKRGPYRGKVTTVDTSNNLYDMDYYF